QRHFSLNGLDPSRARFITGDVFDWLKRFARKQESFDLVILDPPTFSTGLKGVFAGVKGYQKLNVAALSVLRKGGVLICSSNSGEISPKMFYQALQNAAADARVDLQLVDVRFQPPDHPVNIFFPEGRYLKFFVSVAR
ncbi:MAG: class I SAM-dependent rRNA methyltransferase, partial [Planctomycetes bacterium]|nr:class I SAM-dependent rRNA methyltransferase [Planctomycetota bacterium]